MKPTEPATANPCAVPSHIRFENVLIDDSPATADFAGIFLLPDFNPQCSDQEAGAAYPYALPTSLNASNVRAASGRKVKLCSNPIVAARYQKAGLGG